MLYEVITGLVCGRALIGFGVSACLMAAFKAYTMWFARERWPLINGFQMAAGGLGALAATSPVQIRITSYNVCYTKLLRGTHDSLLESEDIRRKKTYPEQFDTLSQPLSLY